MYDIALTVAACLRAGTRVDVAWTVATDGLGPVDPSGALAITPGGGKVGDLLAGAVNDQLVDLAGRGGRAVELRVSELDAQLAGLAGPGTARCLLLPATVQITSQGDGSAVHTLNLTAFGAGDEVQVVGQALSGAPPAPR